MSMLFILFTLLSPTTALPAAAEALNVNLDQCANLATPFCA